MAIAGSAATGAVTGAVLAAVLAGVQGVATGGAAGLAGEVGTARAAGAVAGVVTALLTPVTPSPVTPSFVVPGFVVPGFIMLGNACRRCSAKFKALLEVLAPAAADGAALVPLPGGAPFAVVADAGIRVALAGPLAREAAKDASDTPGGLAKVEVAKVAGAAPGMEQILSGPPGRRGLSEHQEPGMSKAWANGEQGAGQPGPGGFPPPRAGGEEISQGGGTLCRAKPAGRHGCQALRDRETTRSSPACGPAAWRITPNGAPGAGQSETA